MNDIPASADATLHPLTRYRQREHLTIAVFARRANTTSATISRIENGTREPGVQLLRALVAATRGEVTADEIISWQHPSTNGEAA